MVKNRLAELQNGIKDDPRDEEESKKDEKQVKVIFKSSECPSHN